jgi:glycosyltransferase involved in cell wall biosynthesis
MPGISVIVSTVRFQTLPHTVQSVREQTFADWELIVIDQSHSPETRNYLTSLGDPRIQHVPQEIRGLSNGRNAGIRASSADILAFTDDDCEAEPGWLAAIQDRFREQATDILFGPLVPPPTYRPGAEFCPTYPVSQPEVYTWEALARDIGTGLGANMTLRRRAVDALGAFDPVLGAGSPQIPSAEETDYVLRALAQERRILSYPIPPIRHTYGVRPGAEGKRLEQIGNFGVGAVHQKQLLSSYGAAARPYVHQLYRTLYRHVLSNLLRGRRRQLGINRLRALLKGREYVRRHFQVDAHSLLIPTPSSTIASPARPGPPAS